LQKHLLKRFLPNPRLDILPVLNSNYCPDKIPLVTPREVAEEIRTTLSPKNAPGFDLITGDILKNFKRKALVKLTMLINVSIQLNYIQNAWNCRNNHYPENW
jgi:hypothetical protein